MLLNCVFGRRFLRVLWTARRSNQLILKEISPEYSLEGLMLKLKLQYFGLWPPDANWLIGKGPDAGKIWSQKEKGTTEDKMVGWHHQLNRHEFEQALWVGDGQGGLACYSPWGRKESDMTEQLNWTEQHNKNDFLCQIRCKSLWIHGDALITCLTKVGTKSQSEVNFSFNSVTKLFGYSLSQTFNYESITNYSYIK